MFTRRSFFGTLSAVLAGLWPFSRTAKASGGPEKCLYLSLYDKQTRVVSPVVEDTRIVLGHRASEKLKEVWVPGCLCGLQHDYRYASERVVRALHYVIVEEWSTGKTLTAVLYTKEHGWRPFEVLPTGTWAADAKNFVTSRENS
jgi:hypothetical protein